MKKGIGMLMKRFGLASVIAVVLGIAASVSVWLARGPEDWRQLGLRMATELVGAVMVYLLIEVVIGGTDQVAEEKTRLIRELGSGVNQMAVEAAERLRLRGWLVDGSVKGADLSGANLQGADLRDANLQGVDLIGANLQGAILWDADLQGAELIGANLQGATLWNADLQGAFLKSAKLQGATLEVANLEGAFLTYADLEGANLKYANLEGATLWGADLQGADLRGANLQAYLRDASLQGADLRGANLQGAYLWGADLQGADLEGAEFDENTTPPDGETAKWTPETDMSRFTDPQHPDFWRSNLLGSPAYRGKE